MEIIESIINMVKLLGSKNTVDYGMIMYYMEIVLESPRENDRGKPLYQFLDKWIAMAQDPANGFVKTSTGSIWLLFTLNDKNEKFKKLLKEKGIKEIKISIPTNHYDEIMGFKSFQNPTNYHGEIVCEYPQVVEIRLFE